MRGIGVRMAEQMHMGQFSAYIADDDRYDSYVFKCTVAHKDQVFSYDGNEFPVKKGELYCEGLWLDKVLGTSCGIWGTVLCCLNAGCS